MKLIIIFGPQAVGKMTVGQELEKITGLKLFHNHMTFDLVYRFCKINSPGFRRLVKSIRLEVFKELSRSKLKGVIFTYAWAFNKKSHSSFIDQIVRMFKKRGAQIYYVELEAALEERLRRNKTSRRLRNKPSKRDLVESERSLHEYDAIYKLNTEPGEFRRKNYLRINNTHLSAPKVAKMIQKEFNL